MAEDFGVTTCKSSNNVMGHILEKAYNSIYFPSRAQQINNAKLLWQMYYHLQTFDALDCTHIKIKKNHQCLGTNILIPRVTPA